MRKSPEFAGMMQRQEYDEALYYVSEQMMTTGAAVLAILVAEESEITRLDFGEEIHQFAFLDLF